LFNVTIYGNSAVLGGAIGAFGNNLTLSLINCILWDNSPHEIYFVGDDDDSEISYALVTANSNIKNGKNGISANNRLNNFWLDGNINSNPLFTDPDNGDFRLQVDSPCIDAGIHDTMIIYNDDQDTIYIPPMNYVGNAPDMGAYEYGDPKSVEQETEIVPSQYSLHQNYPNPFNPSTTIKYDLPKASVVKIEVFNSIGQKIQTLLKKKISAGNHQVELNAQDLSSGVYFYRIDAGEFQDVKKMILLK